MVIRSNKLNNAQMLFTTVLAQFVELPKNKIVREKIRVSLVESKLEPYYSEFDRLINETRDVYEQLPAGQLQELAESFQRGYGIFFNLLSVSDENYVQEAGKAATELESVLENLYSNWHFVFVKQLEKSGLGKATSTESLHESIQLKIKGLVEEVFRPFREAQNTELILFEAERKASATAFQETKAVLDKQITEIKDIQSKIDAKSEELLARQQQLEKSANKISVQLAQEQFTGASKENIKKIILWTSLSLVAVASLSCTLYYYSIHLPPSDLTTGQLIYKASLRVVTLSILLGFTAFFLKLLRSDLHMFAINKHRLRLTNSMAAFIESAHSPEQQDIILTHLVEAVSAFGNSGLLSDSDDSMNPTKTVIENIVRASSQK